MSKWASALNDSCSADGGSLVHTAAEDLEHICEWIERDNPETGRRVARTTYEGCARLKDFPNLGRASRRSSGRRELTFPPLPYVVAYEVKPNAIEISRIFHGAQDWP
jgi:toxin ParE1/3/4